MYATLQQEGDILSRNIVYGIITYHLADRVTTYHISFNFCLLKSIIYMHAKCKGRSVSSILLAS